MLGRHDVLRWKCNKVANILCRVYLLVCKFALIVCLSYFCELDTRTKVLSQLTNLRRDRPKRLVNRFLIQYHAIVVTCSKLLKTVLSSTQKIVWENNFGCEGFLQIAADIYLPTMDLGRRSYKLDWKESGQDDSIELFCLTNIVNLRSST